MTSDDSTSEENTDRFEQQDGEQPSHPEDSTTEDPEAEDSPAEDPTAKDPTAKDPTAKDPESLEDLFLDTEAGVDNQGSEKADSSFEKTKQVPFDEPMPGPGTDDTPPPPNDPDMFAAPEPNYQNSAFLRDPVGMVAGLASSVAKRFGFDVNLVRVAFVVIAFATSGLGLIAYLAAWILVPKSQVVLQQRPPFKFDRENQTETLVVGGGLIAFAIGVLTLAYVASSGFVTALIPVALIFGGIWLLKQAPREQLQPASAAHTQTQTSYGQQVSGFSSPAIKPKRALGKKIVIFFAILVLAVITLIAGITIFLATSSGGSASEPYFEDREPEIVACGPNGEEHYNRLGHPEDDAWIVACNSNGEPIYAADANAPTTTKNPDAEKDATSSTLVQKSTLKPKTLAEIPASSKRENGDISIDLTAIKKPAEGAPASTVTITEPRTFTTAEGTIEVTIPAWMAIEVSVEVGNGSSRIFDQKSTGTKLASSYKDPNPNLILDLKATSGEIIVNRK